MKTGAHLGEGFLMTGGSGEVGGFGAAWRKQQVWSLVSTDSWRTYASLATRAPGVQSCSPCSSSPFCAPGPKPSPGTCYLSSLCFNGQQSSLDHIFILKPKGWHFVSHVLYSDYGICEKELQLLQEWLKFPRTAVTCKCRSTRMHRTVPSS